MEKAPISLDGLMKQPANMQTICTACSAFNWLKLKGAPIKQEVGQAMIELVTSRKLALRPDDFRNFASQYGYKVNFYHPNEEHQTVEEMFGDLDKLLDQSPLLHAISTHLSKKPEGAKALTSAQDLVDFEKGKLLLHEVVMVKESDEKIMIIDPYAPQSPEEFNIKNDGEKLRLLSWVMSPYYHYKVEELGQVVNKENILKFAQMELPDLEVVKKMGANLFGMVQAHIKWLT